MKIGLDFSLPAEDFLESAIGIIGKRGRGKTGLVKVLMEELVRVELPFVSFDPIGVAWGLRSSLDGTGPGMNCLIVGGPHGDIRLERRAGTEIAKAIVQANVSCIVDFSEESRGVYREFVRDFSHTLFHTNDVPRVVIIEEAPELVPQRLRPDMTEVFESVERLVSRGRNKGIGVTLVSQRAATVNKDVLTQVDALFVFGLVSPQDRKAIEEWVEAHDVKGKATEFMEGLAALERQECWIWYPERDIFRKIRIRDFTTFHPDRTHLRRMGLLTSKPVTTDVSEIVGKLGKAMERFSKERAETVSMAKTGRELEKARYRNETLERELADLRTKVRSLPKPGPAVDPKAIEERAVLRVRREYESRLSIIRTHFERVRRALDALAGGLGGAIGEDLPKPERGRLFLTAHQEALIAKSLMSPSMPKPVVVPRETILRGTQWDGKPEGTIPGEDLSVPSGALSVPSGAKRILTVLATHHPTKLTRSQLGTLSHFTPSGGTYQNYLSLCRKAGFITEDGGQLSMTKEGLEYVGEVPPAPTSPEETIAMWKQRVPTGAGKILDEIVKAYPESVTLQEIGERIDMTYSGGTFQNYVSILKNNGLIEKHGQVVKATPVLLGEV